METIKNIDWNAIRDLLLSSSPSGYALQYGILALDTLIMIYIIIRGNRERVIVLSHTRIWVETLVASLVTFGFYRLAIWLAPKGTWPFILFLVGLFLSNFIMRAILQMLVFVMDRGRSLKDLGSGPEAPFNCNWPLIPRCANFCSQQIIVIVLFWARTT
ncbi:MAG TPA: hypothetical protein VGX92_00390 [Pyrinomonadaceae bacterium]|jgi:hypothetical protein|nr:hypothetical protein [Pyrinomonadaceae bacterium]